MPMRKLGLILLLATLATILIIGCSDDDPKPSITSLTARAAAILNLSEDHMDRYPDFAAYIAAKSRIFAGDGLAILNRSDKRVMQALPPGKRFISFGSSFFC